MDNDLVALIRCHSRDGLRREEHQHIAQLPVSSANLSQSHEYLLRDRAALVDDGEKQLEQAFHAVWGLLVMHKSALRLVVCRTAVEVYTV